MLLWPCGVEVRVVVVLGCVVIINGVVVMTGENTKEGRLAKVVVVIAGQSGGGGSDTRW